MVDTQFLLLRQDIRRIHLQPGDRFYFKLKGGRRIGGRATFREQLRLTLEDAWKRFGKGNGAASVEQFEECVRGALNLEDNSIGCLILERLEILPRASMPEIKIEDFPVGIQNGKFFEEHQIGYISSAFR